MVIFHSFLMFFVCLPEGMPPFQNKTWVSEHPPAAFSGGSGTDLAIPGILSGYQLDSTHVFFGCYTITYRII
jgi:hypothetical protein